MKPPPAPGNPGEKLSLFADPAKADETLIENRGLQVQPLEHQISLDNDHIISGQFNLRLQY
jgi:hypothetical protein